MSVLLVRDFADAKAETKQMRPYAPPNIAVKYGYRRVKLLRSEVCATAQVAGRDVAPQKICSIFRGTPMRR